MAPLLPLSGVPLRPALQPPRLTLSVIIPVFNGGLNFRRCLSNLADAVPPPDEIIVVADGDTDGSSRLAEAFATKVVRVPTPNGPARARNLGARNARGELLFFMDADVTIPPDLIGRITAPFRDDPGLAALFGTMTSRTKGIFYPSIRTCFTIMCIRRREKRPRPFGRAAEPFAATFSCPWAASTRGIDGP